MAYPIGPTPGITRDELERDFWGALRRVAEVGYRSIESSFAPNRMVECDALDGTRGPADA